MDNGASSYRRYLDGDESAFDDIVKELFDHLVFFVNRYVQDVHAAEDIAIDAFTELIVHKNRYNFGVTLKTYLFMIGRSRALNYIKRRNRIKMEPLSAADSVEAGETPEQLLLRTEKQLRLSREMDALPQPMRTALHLVYFEDLSYQEAARVMKKTKKQIDNLVYRGKKALRAALGEDGANL